MADESAKRQLSPLQKGEKLDLSGQGGNLAKLFWPLLKPKLVSFVVMGDVEEENFRQSRLLHRDHGLSF
jgi:hypothetical protein